ncbi:P52 family lipoprotein [Borrelia turicatae]|uniref:P52 family lipoprotein n=1 Tax=Borrelia turicatae TaxID=142 RepID=UPI002ED1567F
MNKINKCFCGSLIFLSCTLPIIEKNDKPKAGDEAIITADDETIVTTGIFSDLRLNISEDNVLKYIKLKIEKRKKGEITLQDSDNQYPISPMKDRYNEENFNKFFINIGSVKTKELLGLFKHLIGKKEDALLTVIDVIISMLEESKYTGNKEFNQLVENFTPGHRFTYEEIFQDTKKILECELKNNNCNDILK